MGNPWFLKMAIAKAKRRHRKTGLHYRVYFLHGRFRIMSRIDLQRAKHAGKFDWHVNSTNMEQYSFFSTLDTPLCFLQPKK